MSEKRFTNVSIGMEEAYCDFSIIKIGDEIISDGIPTTDAIGICILLNVQDRKIRQLEKSIERREEQISIIKKHCLKFLTDEQFETIRKELENE